MGIQTPVKGVLPSSPPERDCLFEDATKFLDKVKMDFSVQEENFVRQSLATRAITPPKLTIKHHKKTNRKEEFPIRLVIPGMNFTATFSEIGYLGMKRMLDKSKENYSRVSIWVFYSLCNLKRL